MAEAKKRGRPPKKKDDEIELKNEKKESIKMEEHISIVQPYDRMRQIFSKYSTANLNYTDYLSAMGSSFNNNPFIKNSRLKQINSPQSSCLQVLGDLLSELRKPVLKHWD